MRTNLIFYITVLIAFGLFSCAPQETEIVVYPILSPDSGTIYNNGVNYFEIKAEPSSVINNSIVMEKSIDVKSLRAFEGDTRFTYFKVNEQKVHTKASSDEIIEKEMYVLTFPEYQGSKQIVLNYEVRGIKWEPSLEIEILDDKTVAIYYYAYIKSNSYKISNTNISLVYSRSPNRISTDSDRFDLGRLDLLDGEEIIYTLKNAEAPYHIEYNWYASNSPYVTMALTIKNSFESLLYGISYKLMNDRMLVTESTIMEKSRLDDLTINIGREERIKTYRAVATEENLENETHPYTHTHNYSVVNSSGENLTLNVIVNRQYGMIHRNIYMYQEEPDQQPGDKMIWVFDVPEGLQEDISFSFISESKDSGSYSSYDRFEGGR